jgi:hypothetical protein
MNDIYQGSMSGGLGLGGMQIQPSKFWPKVEDGFETKRVTAHPLIHWLARWFPIEPWVEVQVRRLKDADPVIYMGRVICCSYAQYEVLRQRFGR